MGKFPVHQLIESGYMFIPVDPVSVDMAKAAWKWFIEEEKDSVGGFPIVRRGEPEPDLGHIVRHGVQGGDKKHFLHIAHDLCLYMRPHEKLRFRSYQDEFAILDDFRKYLNTVAVEIAAQLDVEYGDVFSEPLAPNVRQCTLFSKQYATTTLRSLWYPPCSDQDGAAVHVDRNLFSIHVGDFGGQLIAYTDERGKELAVITPEPGFAVVFFGVKALYLSQGKVAPLWHGSHTKPHEERHAMVHFVQADVGFDMSHAREAYHAFYQNAS